jgi:hypothetical protein
VSDVWEIRNRLILAYLEKLANQLRSKEPVAPAQLEEQTVRLLAALVMSLRQHRVTKRGQCRYCSWRIKIWRFGHRRPRCAVYRALNFALHQHLDVVWWQLLEDRKVEP